MNHDDSTLSMHCIKCSSRPFGSIEPITAISTFQSFMSSLTIRNSLTCMEPQTELTPLGIVNGAYLTLFNCKLMMPIFYLGKLLTLEDERLADLSKTTGTYCVEGS